MGGSERGLSPSNVGVSDPSHETLSSTRHSNKVVGTGHALRVNKLFMLRYGVMPPSLVASDDRLGA